MKKAFLNLDAELRKSPQADSSGCTAVCCLITPCGRLVVGNAGDSRCIMSRGGKPWALSFDHKPTNEEERARITAAGGFVTSGRVQGNLALSRAIGDYEFKNNTSLSPEEQMVTANPEITVTEIREGDEYIVLACDGIWDCMTNEEVIDFVSKGINDYDVARVCEDTCDRYAPTPSLSHPPDCVLRSPPSPLPSSFVITVATHTQVPCSSDPGCWLRQHDHDDREAEGCADEVCREEALFPDCLHDRVRTSLLPL